MRNGGWISLVLAIVVLAGCAGDAGAPPPVAATVTPDLTAAAPNTVSVAMFRFRPASIEVGAGGSVVWQNSDRILHTATSGTPEAPQGVFDGEMPDAGTTFTHRFEQPGTYQYICSRHPSMRGEVVVR
ncbi:MAG: amidase [Dehalococcoidia bacterium]|nr:amidase [Dehalococcoidia bacterium]